MASDISARELTRQLWEEVAAERALRTNPHAGLGDYDRLINDSERHYLNSRYVLRRSPRGSEGGERWLRVNGALRLRAAQFVLRVLERYFDDEQEFLAHLVRLQNTVTANIDRLSAEVRQLESLLQAESERLGAADAILHARLEERINALEEQVAGIRKHSGEAPK